MAKPKTPQQAARQAGLVYVDDGEPGIRRVRKGRGFRYTGPRGKPVADARALARIKALAIPPAWTDVWICTSPRGHIQATGRDARGRKQYRYHAFWKQTRSETKYHRMISFGKTLPVIRRRLREDLDRPGLPREKVLGTIVRLIDLTYIRVGNERYARENRSYGLTTMRDRHVEVDGGSIRFAFRGKEGINHTVDVRDPRIARIVKRCEEIPGHRLFQYLDEQETPRPIASDDVNAYLAEIAGADFTAKDFRTWAGSVLALRALYGTEPATSAREARRNVNEAISTVASALGNTVTVCRSCYVHPAVIDAYVSGALHELKLRAARAKEHMPIDRLRPDESALLRLLHSVPAPRDLETALRESLAAAAR